MNLGSYSLEIVGGAESPGGYVSLYHGKQYQICLRNRGGIACACAVSIDGKSIGRFQIGWGSEIVLERSPHDAGCFTFVEYGSPEAFQIGMALDTNLGLIKADFYPELLPQESHILSSQAGGTALTGESEQLFESVRPLQTANTPSATIYLRLTSGEPPKVRPLASNPALSSTPFPPLILPKNVTSNQRLL